MRIIQPLPLCALLFALCALLAACSPSGMLEKIADAEKLKIARDYIEQLKSGDLEKLAAELDPSLRNDKELEQLKTMRAMIPAEPATVTATGVGVETDAHLLHGSGLRNPRG